MTTRLDILLLSALCLLLAATVGSCAQNELDIPEEPKSPIGNNVCVKLKIFTDDALPSTRLSFEGAANPAERILNLQDMSVLIFDKDGALIQTVKPELMEYNDNGALGDGYYSLSVFMDGEYFDGVAEDAEISFGIMLLANLNGIGGTYGSYTPGTSLDDIQESFVMQHDWHPSLKQGIPMYGYQNVSVRGSQLIQEEGAVIAESINMLRALCKVEVNDDVINAETAADGLKYPHVTNVEMISWNDDGYLTLPYNSYLNGRSNIYPAQPATQSVTAVKTDDVFRLYCPEAKLADMHFRVHAVLAPGEDPQPFDVSLEQYKYVFNSEDLVRNHIYRFNVRALGTSTELTASVSSWSRQEDEYELNNIVSMDEDGFLAWSFNSDNFSVSTVNYYDGAQEQMLSMLNGTEEYATGTFHILSPEGALWRAYLIPAENGVDAFEFVDVDRNGAVLPGSESSFAEGVVGKPATIHIRGKGPADAYRHIAELVVEVRTLDGLTLYAPLTPSPDMSSRFIIYRENSF